MDNGEKTRDNRQIGQPLGGHNPASFTDRPQSLTIPDLLADLEAKARQAIEQGAVGKRRVYRLTESRAKYLAARSPDRVLALVAYVRRLETVAKAAHKEVEVRNAVPRSRLFRHDVVLHGGIQHHVGSPCELCDSLKELAGHLDAPEEKT